MHISVGVLLIITGIIHGILAGNLSDANLSDMMFAPVLFTWNWGTLSLIAAILLAASYMLRKILKRKWIAIHRILTIALIALVVLHVADVGIQIDDRIQSISYAESYVESPIETIAITDLTSDATDLATATVTNTPVTTATNTTAVTATGTVTAAATDTTVATNTADSELVAEANAMFSGAVLTDGVYTGSATGYNGNISVSVTVSGGQVTDITITGENDTPSYFRRAESVVDTIISEQSLAVDAVSGATYSSAGIVNAVADALSSAVTSGSLDVTEFSYSRHGGPKH
ncbi:MAG: FMN-binding protein [Eubacteriales bacterium]|nr:FMN-binding protein [Eubacteriales bacterium]